MIGLTGSVFRGVGSYGLIKSGISLLLIPEPTPATKIAGIFVTGYGIGEAIFSFLDSAESGQDVYYGVTNQKDKKSVNFGKYFLGEEGYMILNATSGTGAPMMYQFSDYTRVMAEGEAAQRALATNMANQNQVSNVTVDTNKSLNIKQQEGQSPQQGQRSQDNLAQNNKNSINKTQAQGNQDYSGNQQISKGSTSNNQQGAPISKTLDMKDNLASQVSNNMSYGQTLSLPVKYPIVTKSGVTLYKGYAMGPRGAKYTEVGVSNNKEIVYKNSNGSYFKLTDNGLENISSKDVIKKEYFPTVKVQKNNGSNPSAGKDYYVSKEGNFKVKKYIEAGQTIEDYDKIYLIENVRARGINVGRSKEHTNTTLGHWEKAIDIADEASKDSNVKAVYVDEALRNISDKFKDDKTIPDVTIEYEDGTFKFIEVKSLTDDRVKLENKLRDLQTKYGKDIIKDFEVVNPKGGK